MNRWQIGGICLFALGCSDEMGTTSSEARSIEASGIGGQGGAPSCTLISAAAGFSSGSLVMEAENLPVAAVSAGDTFDIVTSVYYSNQQAFRLRTKTLSDSVIFGPISCPVGLTGHSWDIQLRSPVSFQSPIVQMRYAPSASGPWYDVPTLVDLFSTTDPVRTYDLGRVVFQDTPTFVQFAVVGKNPLSRGGYLIGIDYLEFIP